MSTENQINPQIQKRRGLKDNWPQKTNPGNPGGEGFRAAPSVGHGHVESPRGRRKHLGG